MYDCQTLHKDALACSNDLTTGVRATAQMMAATRATITESALLANAVVASHVLPAVRSRIPGARSECHC